MTRLSKLLILVGLIFLPSWVHAHEVRPGYLELRESQPGLFSTTWKVPARGDYRLAIQPYYPEFCRQIREPMTAQADGAFIERGRIRCDKPLAGSRIFVHGLEATQTDVLVRIEGTDGAVETEHLTPSQPGFIVPANPSRLAVFWTYFQLGVEHILTGVDHLLFVLCLVLLVRDIRMLLATVTAFTVAHSITLAAATLGFVNVRSAPVEATIALTSYSSQVNCCATQPNGATSRDIILGWLRSVSDSCTVSVSPAPSPKWGFPMARFRSLYFPSMLESSAGNWPLLPPFFR